MMILQSWWRRLRLLYYRQQISDLNRDISIHDVQLRLSFVIKDDLQREIQEGDCLARIKIASKQIAEYQAKIARLQPAPAENRQGAAI